MDWKVIFGWIVGLGALAGALLKIGRVFDWVRRSFVSLRRRVSKHGHALPTRTVVLVQESHPNALWWHGGGNIGGKPSLQVCGDFHATNIWKDDVRLTGALVRFPAGALRRVVHRGDALVKDLILPYYGGYPIPPGQTTSLRVHFIFPWHRKSPNGRVTADIGVIDQFGNHQWFNRLEFYEAGKPLSP